MSKGKDEEDARRVINRCQNAIFAVGTRSSSETRDCKERNASASVRKKHNKGILKPGRNINYRSDKKKGLGEKTKVGWVGRESVGAETAWLSNGKTKKRRHRRSNGRKIGQPSYNSDVTSQRKVDPGRRSFRREHKQISDRERAQKEGRKCRNSQYAAVHEVERQESKLKATRIQEMR